MSDLSPLQVSIRTSTVDAAAHIVADKDEQFGQPVVSNGIPLSKIHHAAFDAHLIGSIRIIAYMFLIACWRRTMAPCSKY